MEGLVNYSSEDEQDEQNAKLAAERGSRPKLATANGTDEMRERMTESQSSSRAEPPLAGSSNNVGSRSHKEDTQKHKSSSAHTNSSSSRSSSHYSRLTAESRDSKETKDNKESKDCKDNRETKDSRDTKDNRDNRDSRDRSHSNRNDYKASDRSSRTKEHSRDHRRDNNHYHESKRSRDDDRHQRSSYSSRYSSSQSKDRFNSSSRHNSSSTDRRHQRSRDDRGDNRSDHRTDRSSRKQRTSKSRSQSPTGSSKRRASRHDEQRRNRSQASRSPTPLPTPSPSTSTSTSTCQKAVSVGGGAGVEQETPYVRESLTKPLEQARNTALDLEKKLIANESRIDRGETRLLPRPIEALLSLPLCKDAPKQATVITVLPPPTIVSVTQESTMIQLPSYYNPSVINPNKYAEQVQKRKLIWGSKKTEDASAKWGNAQFSQDSDGKVASKFMRLMGIKGGNVLKAADASTEDGAKPAVTDVKSREQMFSSMEQQYEVARQATHTMRGVGLGFSSQSRPF